MGIAIYKRVGLSIPKVPHSNRIRAPEDLYCHNSPIPLRFVHSAKFPFPNLHDAPEI